jgi:hydrogenase-4 component B
MTLWPFLLPIAVHALGGIVALALGRRNELVLASGTAASVLASIVGVTASTRLLLYGGAADLSAPWDVPIGELAVGVDALSAFFLLCVYLVSGLAAVYGAGYLKSRAQDKRLSPVVFFFSLLVASMAGVVLARDGVLFLVAWEVMSISGFFLVTFEDERADVRRAGMVYLVASQVGVVFLLALFGVLARNADGFAFADIARQGAPSPRVAGACFLLALAGFGTKAGFWFFHTWLPEAHPAAPSHVSATMSGVMIKMGIYGVLRVLGFLGPPPIWWGTTLVVIGALSGVLGVLHALAQHDLKRLLAYHSVENIGIIALGIGLGLLGQSAGSPMMALFGYGGALLHTLNHGLFKGLLFQGAGSVLHATGKRDIDSLGGLSRSMPVTAATFLVASVAISGLPPLNGFISEWLVYVAAFHGSALGGVATASAIVVIPTLALIGGLAAACFVKAYGVVFLGAPRTKLVAAAHDPPVPMRLSMVVGAALCVGIGIWPDGAWHLVERPAHLLAGSMLASTPMLGVLTSITRISLALIAITSGLALLRAALLRRREVGSAPTWGCGYEAPNARMQYTASSFAEPVLAPFDTLLHRKTHQELPTGYFPTHAELDVHAGDVVGERLIAPALSLLLGALGRLRVIQHGRVQLYLVYILVTVVAVLVWQLGVLR